MELFGEVVIVVLEFGNFLAHDFFGFFRQLKFDFKFPQTLFMLLKLMLCITVHHLHLLPIFLVFQLLYCLLQRNYSRFMTEILRMEQLIFRDQVLHGRLLCLNLILEQISRLLPS